MIALKIDKSFIFDTGLALDKQILKKIQESNMTLDIHTVGINNVQSNTITVFQDEYWPSAINDEEYWNSFIDFYGNLEYEKRHYVNNNRIFDDDVFCRYMMDSLGIDGVTEYGKVIQNYEILEWYYTGAITFIPHWGDLGLLKMNGDISNDICQNLN